LKHRRCDGDDDDDDNENGEDDAAAHEFKMKLKPFSNTIRGKERL